MSRLPMLKPEQVLNALEKAGFQMVRQRGSHVRLRHGDGRVVTVPVHSGHETLGVVYCARSSVTQR
jgi:predicted RNA binding protein YcfA (HicA-like mRNA interferase family)